MSPAGHRGKGPKSQNRRLGQEEIPGALGLDGRAILLSDKEEDSPEA